MAVHVIATSVTFAIAISLTLTYELDSVQRCASCALGVKQPISLRPDREGSMELIDASEVLNGRREVLVKRARSGLRRIGMETHALWALPPTSARTNEAQPDSPPEVTRRLRSMDPQPVQLRIYRTREGGELDEVQPLLEGL